MSTKTKIELATHVLRSLGVIDASEEPDDTDADVLWVIDQYEYKYAELAAPGLELAYWSQDSIPQAIFGILSDLVANEVADSYGQPSDAATKQGSEEIILSKLRRHVSVERSGLPTQAEYF